MLGLNGMDFCQVDACEQYMQCRENRPLLNCRQYKVVDKCVRERTECGTGVDMVCAKGKRDSCQGWEYQCGGKNTGQEKVCAQVEYEEDYNYCIDFRIDCDRAPRSD